MFPHPQIIRGRGWDLSYDSLRKRYRNYSVDFSDGL